MQLVDERSQLGWVIVANLIMSKKLINSFVSFWSDPWEGFISRIAGRSVSFRFLFSAVRNRLTMSAVAGVLALLGLLLKLSTNSLTDNLQTLGSFSNRFVNALSRAALTSGILATRLGTPSTSRFFFKNLWKPEIDPTPLGPSLEDTILVLSGASSQTFWYAFAASNAARALRAGV
jgi:hypothetical protein